MFSIIIPLYNKALYIAKAIQSVAAQTYQEFELIVIDDGSKDESLEKLRVTSYELRENNPDFFAKIIIIEQQNQGVSITRNNGVKLAKYDYIAFLDADDWWEPTFFEEMKALIEEFPEGGIYGSSY
jgi:glycosyltransferase involved in cell wall biosynthesis